MLLGVYIGKSSHQCEYTSICPLFLTSKKRQWGDTFSMYISQAIVNDRQTMLAWYIILYRRFFFIIFLNIYIFSLHFSTRAVEGVCSRAVQVSERWQTFRKQLQVFCIHLFSCKDTRHSQECPGVTCRKQCKLEPQKHSRQSHHNEKK